MTTLEIILTTGLILTIGALSVSVYFNIKHGILILKFIESLEDTLDVLDEKYTKISEVLEIPIFYDSPQIRGVLEDIKDSRDSILVVANQLGRLEEFKIEDSE